MKYINSILLKSACALSIVLMIHSCDNEFSEIGSDIVGLPDFEIQNKAYPIKTYNKRITPFQSNGLDKDLLGYYYDDVFGGSTLLLKLEKSKARFVWCNGNPNSS